MNAVSRRLIIALAALGTGMVAMIINYTSETRIGARSCKYRTRHHLFGIQIATTDRMDDVTRFVVPYAMHVKEEEWLVVGTTSGLKGYQVGTPPGNWLYFYMLKHQAEQGLDPESVADLASGLIYGDQEGRRLTAMKMIRQLSSVNADAGGDVTTENP